MLDKLDDLSDEDDEVELVLEAVRGAVDVKALFRLLASLDEVIDDLGFDLKLVLQDRSEESNGQEACLV